MKRAKSAAGWRVDAETVLMVAAMPVAFCLSYTFDAYERLHEIAVAHESWEIDEIFTSLACAAICFIAVAIHRTVQLRRELRRRIGEERRAGALARHDPLTGLVNRRVLGEAIDGQTDCATDQRLSLLLIDLDRFKPVNDTHGHPAGDRLLCTVADRLRALCSDLETVGRLGGDEFAIVLRHAEGANLPQDLARRIIATLGRPVAIGEALVQVGASVGIATSSRARSSSEDLLRYADIAMCRAKRNGSGGFCQFEQWMEAELRESASLEAELRRGLAAGEIVPYYQPIVRLDTMEPVGFECLARWQHPARGLLPPALFVPVAEDAGLIGQLSTVLLRRACEDMREWPDHFSLSFNMSALQFCDGGLTFRIMQILWSCGIDPSRLIIEITESRVVSDFDAARIIIGALKKVGVKIAIDDFGTGYASLRHLRELQFDRIKIDRSFVQESAASKDNEIVRAILSLGAGLGMPVTAEGVESAGTAAYLRLLGCAYAQGYLFGQPVPAAQALAMARAANPLLPAPPLAGCATGTAPS